MSKDYDEDNRYSMFKKEKPEIAIGDIVTCKVDASHQYPDVPQTFSALVVDRTYSMCIIKVVESGQEIYWPVQNATLWKKCPS